MPGIITCCSDLHPLEKERQEGHDGPGLHI